MEISETLFVIVLFVGSIIFLSDYFFISGNYNGLAFGLVLGVIFLISLLLIAIEKIVPVKRRVMPSDQGRDTEDWLGTPLSQLAENTSEVNDGHN